MTPHQQKVLELYHTKGHEAAWKYWALTNHTYGIFLGEVPSDEFVTGDDLASRLGITEGVSQYSDTPWLKFILDMELIYVPMKPVRHSISWEHIYQAGAVYGTNDNGLSPIGCGCTQDAMVSIDGYDFRVTLLKGAKADPASNPITAWDIGWTHDSEWNKLMYPIHNGVHTHSRNPSNPSEPYNQWASYSESDLLLDYRYGNGTYSWSQEIHHNNDDESYRLYRGGIGVTFANGNADNSSDEINGWRPALRLIY